MASTIKVNNIQNQCGANIANKCGTTITLGASGDTITLACGASQTGFGRTGTVDWDTTAKTSSFTAVSGNGYFVNTTSGAITVTLPAGSAGDIVSLADYTNTWQTNNVTITPNGSDKIGGINENAILSTEGQSVTFVYVDATEGWKNVQDSTSNVTGNPFIIATGGTITTCGNCKIHTFTGPGTFEVTKVGTPANNVLAYLVVAGGGRGGPNRGGGGGGGGFREGRNNPITPYTASPLAAACSALTASLTSYPITVGAGAASNDGSPSTFSTITSTGGGGGAAPCVSGRAGGSGGGSSNNNLTAGTGNTPPVSPPQGNNGGVGVPGAPSGGNAGAGGGAGAVGGNAPGGSGQGGTGGAGAGTLINPATGESGPGCLQYYAGGGGGGSYVLGGVATPAPGGIGGGGAAGTGTNCAVNGEAGTANTGGGGGGGSSPGGQGLGGSGIVIIRYKYQ